VNNKEGIDKLIQEVMEEVIQERLPIGITGRNKSDITQDLGITNKPAKDINYADIAKLGGQRDQVDVADFADIYKEEPPFTGTGSRKKEKNYQFATNVYDKTTDADVRKDLHQAKIDAATKSPDVAAAETAVGSTPDYIAATRASYAAWSDKQKATANEILEKNKALGATLAAPDINLNQLIATEGNPNELLNLAAKSLGAQNDIEKALIELCSFIKKVALGTYEYTETTNQGKIAELLSRMTLTQALLSATRGFEESPMGFLMEGFFALLIQGSVKGSNQEAEDLIHESSSAVTLYSSKFLTSINKIELGKKTATSLAGMMGTTGSQKYAGKQISPNIKYIIGLKNQAKNPTKVVFYKALYDASNVRGAMRNAELITSKIVPIPGAELDLSQINLESMAKNIGVLGQALQADLNAIYKSMNNFKIFVNTYLMSFDEAAAMGSVAEFALLKEKINEAYKTAGTAQRLSENKQKALDKMIEEVILDYTGG
jgi:hypothetical protein